MRDALCFANSRAMSESRMSIERAAEHVTRQYSKDAKISERDLHDRLLKQARMEESQLYEEASRDAPVMHKRPALTEAPGGFTQMPAALKQATRQLEYYHTFSGVFPQIHRAWTTIGGACRRLRPGLPPRRADRFVEGGVDE